MCESNRNAGGLVLTKPRSPIKGMGGPGPLLNGPDVSWLPHCRPGDNQGRDGACAVFAFANWSEIMHRRDISDAECLDVYKKYLRRHGGQFGDGMTFGAAFRAAVDAGWLPGAKGIQRARDLGALREQPLVAGYIVTEAWRRVSASGCLHHEADSRAIGYHAVVIVARGSMGAMPGTGPWIYIENSWGAKWGWRGIGVMSEALHQSMIRKMWRVA